MPKPPSIDDLLRAHDRGVVDPYKVRLPSGVEIEAQGRDDRALTLETIGRLPPAVAVEAITLAQALMKFSASLNAETRYKTGTQKTAAVSALSTAWARRSCSRP